MEYNESDWKGFKRYDFMFEDRKAVIVFPSCEPAGGKWLLKTEYFGAFPDFEIEMLRRGWHLAYVANISRWFLPDDAEAKDRFCEFLSREFGLSDKCLPVGMSCGGMQAVYFAAAHPERINALYLDAPVLNLLSCPCGVGAATDSIDTMYAEFVRHTKMTVADLINYRNHPVDRVPELIKNDIPIFLVCGDSDKTVPYLENGKILSDMYKKSGKTITEVLKPGCDHHPHGLTDPSPLIEFAEKYSK